MKTTARAALALCLLAFCFWGRGAQAQETNLANLQIEQKPKELSSAYGQLFSVQAQGFQPQSLRIDNGTYIFNYVSPDGSPMRSFLLELGWAPKLLEWHGAFYLEGQFAFSLFHGGAAEVSDLPQLDSVSYSLFLFGLDTRIMYAATWFPWKLLIPFFDGGYLYSILYQPGYSGLESAQLGVGNAVASLGLRFWLNRQSSQEGGPPFFLILRLNRVFSRAGDVNLGSTALSGGLSLGL